MGSNAFGCQRKSSPTWRAPRRFGSWKGSEKYVGLRVIWRLSKVWVHFMGCIMMVKITAKWVSEYYGPKFPFLCLVTRFNFFQVVSICISYKWYFLLIGIFKHLVTFHAYVCICMLISFVMHTLGISYGRLARFHSYSLEQSYMV
jgi:hypothetical protein